MLTEAWPPDRWRDTHVLVAVSGGADSVALLRALLAVREPSSGRIILGHVDHGLRKGSDLDAEFVVQLANRLGVEFQLGHVDVESTANVDGDGIEAAARRLRYAWLQRTAERLGARYVAVAHTADDQTATILHRILRGTGMRGLAGMPHARSLSPSVTLIRPLLDASRRDVEEYLVSLGQDFREDETNQQLRFTRNRLRHELLPQLRDQYNTSVDEALLSLGRQAAAAQQEIDRWTEQLREKTVLDQSSGRIAIDCRPLRGVSLHLIQELMSALWRQQDWPQQALTAGHYRRLAEMALATSAGKTPSAADFPGGIDCRPSDERRLVLTRRALGD